MSPGQRRAPVQLTLDLPARQALGREDFFVAASNAQAVAAVDRWPDWPAPALFLVGAGGSGKTHLGEVWRARSGARRMEAGALDAAAIVAGLADAPLLVEDAPGEAPDERAWFHLLNLARERGMGLLVTTRLAPALWPVALPDLRSRLRAALTASIGAPDDALLRAVLVKQFADRQIAADEALVSYILSRMERSLEAARDIVAEIDRRALAERAEISRPFVGRVLSAREAPDLFGEEEA